MRPVSLCHELCLAKHLVAHRRELHGGEQVSGLRLRGLSTEANLKTHVRLKHDGKTDPDSGNAGGQCSVRNATSCPRGGSFSGTSRTGTRTRWRAGWTSSARAGVQAAGTHPQGSREERPLQVQAVRVATHSPLWLKRHDKVRNYLCTHCAFTAFTRQKLNIHISRMHKDVIAIGVPQGVPADPAHV